MKYLRVKKTQKHSSTERCAAKMGTDRLLGSVPDFRITNNQQRTTNNRSCHPTMVLAQKSRPSSVVPERGPVLRKSEKRRERERVREKRERKWGLTGSWRLYPIFAVALLGISPLPTIFALLLFTTHYSPHTTHNRSYHPTLVLAQRRQRC